MRRVAVVLCAVALLSWGCGDDDDTGGPDAAAGADGAPGPDGPPAGDTPSTNANAPVALAPGQTFSAGIANGAVHFFSFTPAAAGRFTVNLQGPAGIATNWCVDSTAQGCACLLESNFATCCLTMDTTSCSYTLEKNMDVPLDANVTIYPQVYIFAPGGDYTLSISQAL
jgi:hypothetical protein